MTVDKQDMFIQQTMADCNVAVAASREASPMLEVTVVECEVLEVDFVRSSR
jgi:hypothetical protein